MQEHPGYSKLQLLALQITTLFLVDSQQRLQSINEPDPPPAPRFFLGRTSEGNLWRFRADLPREAIERLDTLCRAEPLRSPQPSPPEHYDEIRAVLGSYAPIAGEYRGPAYLLPPIAQAPPQVARLSPAQAHLVHHTFPWLVGWLANPANGPVAAVLEQGSAVSVCFCSRITPQSAEAGIETLEAYRGKGYASAAVAGWAAAVQQTGRLALYSTSWGNHASQAVAKRAGALLYGEDWSIG